MLKHTFLIFVLGLCLGQTVFSQVISPEIVKEELGKRGYGDLDEEEILKRMEERGFDVNNLDPTQLPRYEKALGEVVAEMEQEQEAEKAMIIKEEAEKLGQQAADSKLDEIAKESAEKIEDAIKQGSSVDEAVASEIIGVQNEKLPPSRIYGQNLYRNKSIRLFAKNYDVKPTLDYVLGVGDVVSVDIWGNSEESGTYEIKPEGYIKPTRMPRINLKGVSYSKAKDLVRSRFAQYYSFRPEEFELTVNYSRSININIYGEVLNPGSYTIPALNTGINALVAAGGPSDIGTVRNIRIIGSNGQSRAMDLYKFLLDPSVAKDFYLSNDDYIYVEVARRVVEVVGAVNRPMRYELKDGEQLKQLIAYTGGFTERAYKANIQIKRFENDSERIIDLDYRSLKGTKDFPLFPGDVITVTEIPKPYQNFAEVTGAVEIESKYEINNSTRISDLIGKALLSKSARKDLAFLLRKNPDQTIKTIQVDLTEILSNPSSDLNINVQPEDKLMVLSSAKFTDDLPIVISGAVRNPIEHPYDSSEGFKVSQALLLANGLRKDAANFAYIFRGIGLDGNDIEYIRVDLNEVMANPNSDVNITLVGGDELKVYSTLTFSDDLPVKVFGAVRQPGEYTYDASLNIRDVLSLAGGLELSASRSRIDISRVSIGEDQQTETSLITLKVNEDLALIGGEGFELQPFDQIYVRKAPEFELQRNVSLEGEIQFPGRHVLLDDNERIMSLIERAGGLTKEAFSKGATLYRTENGIGYVVMDLEKAQKDPNSPFNIILHEGDLIEIPKLQQLVTIKGETRSKEVLPNEIAATGKISAPFESGKSANYYVETYTAGVGELGKKHLITVQHPNGELQRTKRFLIFNKYPEVREGSVITVGRKDKKVTDKKEKEDIDWGRVFADSLSQATAILSLILLIQNIN